MLKPKKVQRKSPKPLTRRVEATGCLLWTGMKNPSGYGYVWSAGRRVLVHRMAYELAYGPIPAGQVVCHLCDVRACCEATHLWLGTQAENMADMVIKKRGVRKVSVAHVKDDFAERRRAGRERIKPSAPIPQPQWSSMTVESIKTPSVSSEELIRRHLVLGASHRTIARTLGVDVHKVKEVANTLR